MATYAQQIQLASRRRFMPFVAILLTAFMLIQLAVLYFIYRHVTLDAITREITAISERVENGLRYENGTWDTRLYTSDPQTPHPSGSSGYTKSLYIITADGFVIERNSPINGLLDTSDFKHLMAFQKPQTISQVTNDQWRILSRPIVRDGKTKGVVMAAYYNPDTANTQEIDEKLQKTGEAIDRAVRVSGQDINVGDVDIRTLDYDVSFEVVNSFNKVLLNNGRMPTYIDKSYVMSEINRSGAVRIIQDSVSHKPYLVYTNEMRHPSVGSTGVIVTARSIEEVDSLFLPIGIYVLAFDALALLALYSIIKLRLYRFMEYITHLYEELKQNRPIPKSISFNKKDSAITLDSEVFKLPYASNQYYLCDALFSAPNKRWEHNELLDTLHEANDVNHWRKVYDAMLAVNKKLGMKLIEGRDRTFYINPQMVPAVQVQRSKALRPPNTRGTEK